MNEGLRPEALRAVVVGDGAGSDRASLDRAWPAWADDVGLVVAADGGARLATVLGLRIDRWVGDADSFALAEVDRLRASGVAVELVSIDKDESDLELAVSTAVAAGATDVTILGALRGPRLDHELANVALLAHPALARVRARILDETARVRLLVGPGEADLLGRPGDLVSLLPQSDVVEGIITDGLRYPLADEPLAAGPARGLSNVRLAAGASVRIRSGRLLIVETPVTVAP